MSTSVTKHISFPQELFAKIETNAKRFGVSFGEYLRHLAINDDIQSKTTEEQKWQKWEDSLPIYKATDEKWKQWDEARKGSSVTMTPDEFSNRFKNV